MTSQANVPVIEAQEIWKTYGDGEGAFHALRGVSVAIGKGESIAIVGKSGSGKSTLMHVLALLDKPDYGRVLYDGQDTSTLKAAEINKLRNTRYGFVFQQFFVNPRNTVRENVELPLMIAGIPPVERKKRALEALEAVDLAEKADNRANDLSGGQKQRVVIARALVAEPSIIFADEPTGNLDTVTGNQIIELLFSLNREKGITLVAVTHDQEFAQLFNRQIVLQDGVIVSEGVAA